MFASFVDSKILSQNPLINSVERLAIEKFDRRIAALLLTTDSDVNGETLSHLSSTHNFSTVQNYTNNFEISDSVSSDYEVPKPHWPTKVQNSESLKNFTLYNGIFPELNPEIFEANLIPDSNEKYSDVSNVLYSPWKQHNGREAQQRKQRILNVLEVNFLFFFIIS